MIMGLIFMAAVTMIVSAMVPFVLMIVPVLVAPMLMGVRVTMVVAMAVPVGVLVLMGFAAVTMGMAVKMIVLMGVCMGMFMSSLHGLCLPDSYNDNSITNISIIINRSCLLYPQLMKKALYMTPVKSAIHFYS